MAGMWIAHIEVKDDEAYARYVQGSTKAVEAYDGTFIARGGRYRQFEGRDYPRNVVIRFPTYEKAIACYESEEYQSVIDIAKGASERSLMVLEIDD